LLECGVYPTGSGELRSFIWPAN